MLPRALATNTTSLLRRALTTSTSTRSSQIVPTSTKHLFAPRALSSYSASAIASRFHAATWKPPPPPPPPPGLKEKLVVLFPRQGSRQTTIEVKKRILRSCPHMGGRRLKRLVRMHARKGNSNSFVADFESRLDRVLYRCNAVPSIFAARMAIGHKHVMVNGKITNSTHYLMKPGDVVEPAPGSLPLFERFLRRRLANNSFVFAKDGQPSPQKQIAPPKTPTIQANFGQLLADGAAVAATYRRLPPPREAGGGGGGGGAGCVGERRRERCRRGTAPHVAGGAPGAARRDRAVAPRRARRRGLRPRVRGRKATRRAERGRAAAAGTPRHRAAGGDARVAAGRSANRERLDGAAYARPRAAAPAPPRFARAAARVEESDTIIIVQRS